MEEGLLILKCLEHNMRHDKSEWIQISKKHILEVIDNWTMEEEDEVEEEQVQENFLTDNEWVEQFWKRNLLKNDNTPYKASSINSYRTRMPTLLNVIGYAGGKLNMNDTLERLLESYNYVQAENHLAVLKAILRNLTKSEKRVLLGKPYEQQEAFRLLKEFTDTIIAGKILEMEEKDQYPNSNEHQNYIDWKELYDKIYEYRATVLALENEGYPTSTDELEKVVAVSLHVIDNEPRRNEFGSLTYREDKDKNYYKDGVVVLNNYKTKGAYGTFEIVLTPETRELMETLIKRKRKFYVTEWVFGRDAVNPQSTWHDRLKKYFNSIVNKKLTSRLLRKYRISYLQNTGQLTYLSDRMKISRMMGHSIRQQQGNYTLRPIKQAEKNERTSDSRWSEEETNDLKQLYDTYGNKSRIIREEAFKLGKLINFNTQSIRRKMKRLGLR